MVQKQSRSNGGTLLASLLTVASLVGVVVTATHNTPGISDLIQDPHSMLADSPAAIQQKQSMVVPPGVKPTPEQIMKLCVQKKEQALGQQDQVDYNMHSWGYAGMSGEVSTDQHATTDDCLSVIFTDSGKQKKAKGEKLTIEDFQCVGKDAIVSPYLATAVKTTYGTDPNQKAGECKPQTVGPDGKPIQASDPSKIDKAMEDVNNAATPQDAAKTVQTFCQANSSNDCAALQQELQKSVNDPSIEDPNAAQRLQAANKAALDALANPANQNPAAGCQSAACVDATNNTYGSTKVNGDTKTDTKTPAGTGSSGTPVGTGNAGTPTGTGNAGTPTGTGNLGTMGGSSMGNPMSGMGGGGSGSSGGGGSGSSGSNPYNNTNQCQQQYMCTNNSIIWQSTTCQTQTVQTCQYGCTQGNSSCNQNNAPYGVGTDGVPCGQPPAQPTSLCSTGAWQQTRTANNCLGVWQCPNTNTTSTTSASISCQPTTQEQGGPISISYACGPNAVSAQGVGFTPNGTSGSATVTASSTASSNVNSFTFGCTTSSGVSVANQCSVNVINPKLVLVATPSTVTSGSQSTIGWLTTGMKSCVVSSPQLSDFTANNATYTNTTGSVITPALSQNTEFDVTCTSTSGATHTASTIVTIASSTITTSSSIGSTLALGSTQTISWKSTNPGSNTAMSLWLVDIAAQQATRVIAGGLPTTGSYNWQVPAANSYCNRSTNNVCAADLVSSSTYAIEALLYTPSTAYVGDGANPGSSPTPTYLNSATTSTFVVQ